MQGAAIHGIGRQGSLASTAARRRSSSIWAINASSSSDADGHGPKRMHSMKSHMRTRLHIEADKTEKTLDQARRSAAAYEYLCHLEEARRWLQACAQATLPPAAAMAPRLANGVVLCKLLVRVAPEKIKLRNIFDADESHFEATGLSFRHTDNINRFLKIIAQLGLPEVCIPEMPDIFERKNVPRLIYCLHALSLLLNQLGLAPAIEDLHGVAEFSEADLETVGKEIEEAKVPMPSFKDLSKSTAEPTAVATPPKPPVGYVVHWPFDLDPCETKVHSVDKVTEPTPAHEWLRRTSSRKQLSEQLQAVAQRVMEARQDKELQQAEVELLLKDMLPHVYTKLNGAAAESPEAENCDQPHDDDAMENSMLFERDAFWDPVLLARSAPYLVYWPFAVDDATATPTPEDEQRAQCRQIIYDFISECRLLLSDVILDEQMCSGEIPFDYTDPSDFDEMLAQIMPDVAEAMHADDSSESEDEWPESDSSAYNFVTMQQPRFCVPEPDPAQAAAYADDERDKFYECSELSWDELWWGSNPRYPAFPRMTDRLSSIDARLSQPPQVQTLQPVVATAAHAAACTPTPLVTVESSESCSPLSRSRASSVCSHRAMSASPLGSITSTDRVRESSVSAVLRTLRENLASIKSNSSSTTQLSASRREPSLDRVRWSRRPSCSNPELLPKPRLSMCQLRSPSPWIEHRSVERRQSADLALFRRGSAPRLSFSTLAPGVHEESRSCSRNSSQSPSARGSFIGSDALKLHATRCSPQPGDGRLSSLSCLETTGSGRLARSQAKQLPPGLVCRGRRGSGHLLAKPHVSSGGHQPTATKANDVKSQVDNKLLPFDSEVQLRLQKDLAPPRQSHHDHDEEDEDEEEAEDPVVKDFYPQQPRRVRNSWQLQVRANRTDGHNSASTNHGNSDNRLILSGSPLSRYTVTPSPEVRAASPLSRSSSRASPQPPASNVMQVELLSWPGRERAQLARKGTPTPKHNMASSISQPLSAKSLGSREALTEDDTGVSPAAVH